MLTWAWVQILDSPLFKLTAPAPLQRLVDVFVERHFSLWKAPDMLVWLKAQCAGAVASVRSDATLLDSFGLVRASALASPSLYHHIALSDFNDSIAQIPAEELRDVAGRFMLPDARDAHRRQPMRLMRGGGGAAAAAAAGAAGGARGGDGERRDMPGNPLAAFLWTMMPWNAGRY
jgi:hypothetical protein